MAAATTAAAVLLLLFTLASSDPSLVTLPDSDPNHGAAILLPSERAESEPAETQSADSKPQETEQYEVKSEYEPETDSLPLTTVETLRPVNRHFIRGSFIPIRRGHKCHGHHRRQHNPQFHQLRQRFGGQGFNGQREISFGNDMIVHAKDQDQGFDRSFSSESKGLERWAKYNRGGHTEMEEMKGMVHPHSFHRHRHHREEEEHRHENGIIKGIMKFLNL